MKKYSIIAIVLAAFMMSACEDMLDLKPTSFISDELVFQDEVLINKYVANVYGSMLSGFDRNTAGFGQGWSRSFAGNLDSGTDDFACHSDSRIYTELQKDAITAQNCPFTEEIWIHQYSVIRKCNLIIERIPDVSDAVMPQSDRLRIEAEARFLRAYCYFEIARTFGKCPLIENVQTMDGNWQIPPSSFADIVQFIADECDNFSDNLPVTYAVEETGHATRGAFLALKGRALLYAASPLNSTDNSDKWAAAATASKAVIDLKMDDGTTPAYLLYKTGVAPYRDVAFLKTPANREAIFERRYTFPQAPHNIYMMWAMSTISWNTLYPTQNLVDAYEMKDGSNFDWNNPDHAANPYASRDARLAQTVLYQNAIWTGVQFKINEFMGLNKARCGYGLLKFMERIDETTQNPYGAYAQSNNFPYIRFAEVLLNYAEAQNEALTAPDESVYSAINEVRTRAKQPALAGLNKEQMREKIKQERRVELVLEEHRFYDLRRWKDGHKLAEPIRGMTFNSNGTIKGVVEVEQRAFSDAHYYLPIPLAEQNKNPLLK